jgi:hypothetical protein
MCWLTRISIGTTLHARAAPAGDPCICSRTRHVHVIVIKPKPQTINAKPSTLNPHAYTRCSTTPAATNRGDGRNSCAAAAVRLSRARTRARTRRLHMQAATANCMVMALACRR